MAVVALALLELEVCYAVGLAHVLLMTGILVQSRLSLHDLPLLTIDLLAA